MDKKNLKVFNALKLLFIFYLMITPQVSTAKPVSAYQILIWDNNGTVTSATNPNDKDKIKTILPNVIKTMNKASFNVIISGCKTPFSERNNFNPDEVAKNFKKLMNQLPVNIAIFSSRIGGVECYAVIKKGESFTMKTFHQNSKYKKYVGKFKKPDTGMFLVLKDILEEEFDQALPLNNTVMIGDTWHDSTAAKSFGIDFIAAEIIHNVGN